MNINVKTLAWRLLSASVIGLVCLAALDAAAGPRCPSGKEALEIMKGLAGEWQGTVAEQGEGPGVTVVYRVTSAGSAVQETIFPGTDHEMVTMYYLDEGKLVLTHYCAMANQPRMALQQTSTPQDLVFEFVGGSNINPRKDAHMHGARIRLESADTITGQWTAYKEGKPAEVTRFQLSRKKS